MSEIPERRNWLGVYMTLKNKVIERLNYLLDYYKDDNPIMLDNMTKILTLTDDFNGGTLDVEVLGFSKDGIKTTRDDENYKWIEYHEISLDQLVCFCDKFEKFFRDYSKLENLTI